MSGHLLLVGMMGTGKSTVGRALAAATGRRFVDLDDLIATEAGCSVAELFDREGEAAFRARETAALAEVVASDAGTVVATGGGCVLAAENRATMRAAGTVVWLRGSPSTIAEHLLASDGEVGARPLLSEVGGDRAALEARLATLAGARAEAYAAAAHHVVDVDHRSVDDVASAILSCVGVLS